MHAYIEVLLAFVQRNKNDLEGVTLLVHGMVGFSEEWGEHPADAYPKTESQPKTDRRQVHGT